jgi:hypothetical protein
MATTAPPLVIRRRSDLEEGDERIDDRYVVLAAPPPPADSGAGYLIAGLLVGAVLGAAVGLFLAPRSGAETLRQMRARLPGGLSEAVEEGADSVTSAVTNVVPPPTNAPAPALDPVAQVAQYGAAPVQFDGPAPYRTNDTTAAPGPTS